MNLRASRNGVPFFYVSNPTHLVTTPSLLAIDEGGIVMIKVNVNMDSGDMVIDVKGHAGFAPHGQDIVCSAVSAILQTAVLGIESIAASYPDHVEVNIVSGIDDRPE